MLPLDKHCLSPAAAILHKEKPSPLDLSGLRHPLPSTGHTESPAGQGQELHQGSLRGHKLMIADICIYTGRVGHALWKVAVLAGSFLSTSSLVLVVLLVWSPL